MKRREIHITNVQQASQLRADLDLVVNDGKPKPVAIIIKPDGAGVGFDVTILFDYPALFNITVKPFGSPEE